jgi:formylmethanofuran dehydrogenase subunit E
MTSMHIDGEQAECEHCGEPATHDVELGPLCDDCFEHYADGFRERD